MRLPENFLIDLYEDFQVEESKRYLSKIPKDLKNLNFSLVGGWGVYFSVNEWYKTVASAKRYVYSRDLDFLVEKNDIATFAKYLEDNNFVSEGKYGYIRYYTISNIKGVIAVEKYTYEQAPTHLRDTFIVDLFTNDKTTNTKLIKEDRYAIYLPKIETIFEDDKNFIQKKIFGNTIKIPNPQILLKLKKIGIDAEKRDASKRIKDILDSVALVLCFNLKDLAKEYNLGNYVRKYLDSILKIFKLQKNVILSYFE